MRVIIAGSRSACSMHELNKAVKASGFKITSVVCGMARGADTLGRRWAELREIPVVKFPADWEKHGKSAGMIRNDEMAMHADALIALWDGESKGTQAMIAIASHKKLKIHIEFVL